MSRNNETSGVELVVVGVFAFCLAVVAANENFRC